MNNIHTSQFYSDFVEGLNYREAVFDICRNIKRIKNKEIREELLGKFSKILERNSIVEEV